MISTLNKFLAEPLFDSCIALLNHLHVQINEVSRVPLRFEDLYQQPLTKVLQGAFAKVSETYFIGTVDESSLSGNAASRGVDDITKAVSEGRYAGMMVFAVEIPANQYVTRSECATLTRGFNRIASAQPVVLFIRHGKKLSLATCERSEYTQQWRDGEKLGKVCILRDINCEHPHRGHIDILESVGDKAYPTFEELYKHWMDVFSSELLTKKFYSELSDWYAWAVKVVRFPNDLATEADNQQYNAEAMIRLITRLIFVWFLKQRHLIPEEFFDEKYIADNLIKGFTPNAQSNLFGKSEDSHYYKGVLQNLFFAMLNSPITPEGKDTVSERRFRNGRGDYDNNKLMRYEDFFINPDHFVELANKQVPFLNGGLFDCLDDKDNGVYIDAFTDREAISRQLIVPDYLFFGEDVGRNIDLSEWYGDAKKRKVSARGIIDILKRYNFTIEENTPLEQEVSLDPELLGKVFENLLASYNPETQTTARKQTGSFYTPREIVQYMVDESLIAHLKRMVGEELEPELRKLLQYNEIEPNLTADQKKQVMKALYNCKVLDPACGSGAFPMGMLQQMVHILNRIDPDNTEWKEMMLDNAISETSEAYRNATNEERAEMVADIERSFNESINRPDYARKLYLIENCIYGVDIQPIAIQISKLRFFISLVVDQKTNNNPVDNFGIRSLPNLEAKFVAANTLIGLEKKEANLFDTDAILQKEKELKEAKHKIFGAKTVKTKRKYKERVAVLRKEIAGMLEESGSIGNQEAQQLASWDMFDQHTSSPFFDPEWMFGVSDGFDVVIANPPYGYIFKNSSFLPRLIKQYVVAEYKVDAYSVFTECGCKLLNNKGVLCFIMPYTFISGIYFSRFRNYLKNAGLNKLVVLGKKVFEAAEVDTTIMLLGKGKCVPNVSVADLRDRIRFKFSELDCFYVSKKKFFSLSDEVLLVSPEEKIDLYLKLKTKASCKISDVILFYHGIQTRGNKMALSELKLDGNYLPIIKGADFHRYILSYGGLYINFIPSNIKSGGDLSFYRVPQKLVLRTTADRIVAAIDTSQYLALNSVNVGILTNKDYKLSYILGVINSKLMNFWYTLTVQEKNKTFAEVKIVYLERIPIVAIDKAYQERFVNLVQQLINESDEGKRRVIEDRIDFLVYHLYDLTYNEVLVVDPETAITREEYGMEEQ